ncbi:MAG TPA: phosphoribosylformylglycinamidine synthase subunit PurL [Candidatus Limnocylindrales bacterium]|nr:phosphoribosylformylglycinamidine synthase subunit PurL [Candidatus Limnocylindrales bacterium]
MSTTEPAITPELVRKHNLTPEEFEKVKSILGREPTYTELGIFSVMWSEHCSYKNSRPLLKTFPTKSRKILVGAGEENAGIIDIGDGLAIAFKIESHNHPSAVEPFQGAATGVGGIIRDIFTMGARPICSINSLRFGPITDEGGQSAEKRGGKGSEDRSNASSKSLTAGDSPSPLGTGEGRGEASNSSPASQSPLTSSATANNRRLFSGVVAGIAHYGNCFGIPTVAGEVYFDKSYEGNPLVNAFCLGVLRHEQIVRGRASGVGNPVFYVGPATGRDGLAGAAFASQDLTEESAEQQRGAVQVGDPFMEKLVCEACLELLATGAVAGIQDMGAAGLTCSTCETAARAGTGIEIDLTKVPQRALNMTPYEIMLSESQERMLIIVQRGREEEVKRVFDKWDLPWAEIGCVTDTGRMVVRNNGQIMADIPAKKLADEAPVYQREAREPEYLKDVRAFTLAGIPDIKDPIGALKALLAWPTIASKNWVYRQYDHTVRAGTSVCPGSDAAVIRIKEDSLPEMPGAVDTEPGSGNPVEKIIALSVDCNAAYVYLDPYEGGKIAVAEAARNLACSGAMPLGVTDNLNFGNPFNPETFWQLRESVRGLAEACRAFNAPVTGGNVSLYNQSPNGPIDPTPTVAMAGLIEKREHITTQWFKDEGDAIILLGAIVDQKDPLQGLGGSAYFQEIHGLKTGTPPRCDLDDETNLALGLRALIHSGAVKSAHDCSEGGLAVALAESCISQHVARETPRLLGATVDVAALFHAADANAASTNGSAATPPRLDALLFGETQGRVLISVAPLDAIKVIERAKLLGLTAVRLGTVGGESLVINSTAGQFTWSVTALYDLWWNSIGRAMGTVAQASSPAS